MTRDLLDRFLRDLGAFYRARLMYPAGNDQVVRAAERAAVSLSAWGQRVRIAWMGQDLLVEDRTLADPPAALRALLERLAAAGREGVHLDPEAGAEELEAWIECVLGGDVDHWAGHHIRVGSLLLDKTQASTARLTRAAAGYLSLIPQVQEALSDLSQEKAGGLTRAREIVRAIASQLATGEELVNPIRDLKTHDDYTFTHALNVCVISAAMCRSLGLGKAFVDAISLAALCHDVGKEKVPPEILNKRGALDPEEKALMDRHPVEGAALLMNLPEAVDPLLPVVAYEHHLGADGSGYPAHPARRRAHPASLLVAVADVYDALRTVRTYQEPRSAAEAVSVMLERGRSGVLQETFLGVFARLLGVLRPSDPVILSDGRRARVQRRRDHDPLRPVVDAEGGGVVDLARSRDLWIEHILDAEG
ncbi:MAG: HD domain-containing protein [Deltaproteobacteria bacterium]|nr:HD domain-containing protein [Deltaproteobacteria bacterium]